ncbi:MAG: GFA family protein [Alphaproteobacteria bacterium]
MSEATVHEGGCLCGAVRYRAEGSPLVVEYCHCGMCRKASGAPVVVWAYLPAAKVVFTRGEPTRYRSSKKAVRGFCDRCGTPLTSAYVSGSDILYLTVASFDRPETVRPERHAWTSSRLPWLEIADDLPRSPHDC